MSASSKKKRKTAPQAQVEVKSPSPLWKWILLGVLVVVAAVGVGFWYFSQAKKQIETASVPRTPEEMLNALSEREFQGVEKRVVDKIRTLINEVKSNPSSAHAWGKLAMNLDVHDLENEAMICYKKAGELNPSDARWPYYRAIMLYDRGAEESLKDFEQSLNLRPNNLAGRIRYGQALLDSGRLEQAGREFVKTLEIDPKSSHAYVGLARISLTQGQVRDCGSLLQKAIQTNPRHGEAYGLMAEVYRRLNEPQKANAQLLFSQQLPKKTALEDEMEVALMEEGESSYWHDLRGRAALERGDYRMAEQELKLAVEAAPDPRYHDTLGVIYISQRKYTEAAAEHRKALQLNPKSTSSMNNLASALYEMGQKQEALDMIQKAIDTDPAAPFSYLHLARLNVRNGDRKSAIEAYRTGLQKMPQNPDFAMQLAWLLATSSDASLRNGAEAVRLAEGVAGRNPNAETLDILAAAYAETGRYDRAIQAGEAALASAEANRRRLLVERIKTHLKAFRTKRPFYE